MNDTTNDTALESGYGKLPVFTTSEPGCLGTHGITNDEFIAKMKGPKNMDSFNQEKRVILYIHGLLEDRVGYDIPIWLSGGIKNVEHQRARLYHPDGTSGWDCWIHIQENEDRYVGLLCMDLPAERKKAADYHEQHKL